MAGRISGITIEIGGDTTKLNDALKKTDSQIKKSQSNLKDINKLLKMNPGNTVLLEQKQKNLANAIGETKNRLQQLKQAEEQMRGTDMTAEQRLQYEALQREIISTEMDLKRLESQMKEFGSVGAQKVAALGEKFEQAGAKIKAVGDSISGAGQALLPVTAAIVGLGTASIKTAASFEDGMASVQATLGITADEEQKLNGETVNVMDTLESLARKMGAETKFSAMEAADGINILAMAGYDLEQIYTGLPQLLSLAAAGDLDIAAAADITTGILAGFNMETAQSADVVDKLAKLASSAKGNVSSFGEGLSTVAGQAQATNQTFDDVATALGILGNNNISASQGGKMLQRVQKNLYQPTAAASKELDALGVAAYNADGSARALPDVLIDLQKALGGMNDEAKNAALSQIFDAASIRGANALIGSAGDAYDELKGKILDSADAAQQMADVRMETLSGQLQILKSQTEEAGIAFGKALMPQIRELVAKAQKAADWINNLSDEQKRLIIRIAAVTAAAGPALIVVGKTVSAVGSLTTGVGKLMKMAPKIKGGIDAAKAAVLGLNPAVLATVGAVAAVAGGIALSIKLHKDYVEKTYGLTEAQKKFNAQLADSAESFRQSEQARQEAIAGIDSEIGQYSRLWDELQSLVDENGKVKEGYEARASVIAGLLNNALGTEIDLTDGAIRNYQDLVAGMDELIQKKRVMAYLEANQGAYEDALKGVSAAQTEYYKQVSETSKAYDQLTAARKALEAAEAASDPTSPGYIGQIGHIMHLATAVQEAEKTYNEMKAVQDEAAESYYTMQNTISNTEALMVAAESGEKLSDAMQNAANGFVTAENATRSMLENQLANFESTYEAMKTAAASGQADITAAELREMKRMVDQAKAELDKGGVDSGKAFAAGMESTTSDAAAAGSDLKAAAEGGMGNDQYSDGYTKGSDYGRGLVNGLEAHYDRVRNAAARLAGAIPKSTATTLQERSPSKLAEQSGAYWDEGLINGLVRGMPAVARTAAQVSGAMITGNASPMIRFPETQTEAQNITVTAPTAPTDGTVARALNVIISQLGNLGVTVRNADGVTNYINKRMGRISTLEAEGVI